MPLISGILVLGILLNVGQVSSFNCEFTDPDCGWTWADGWTLLTAENTSSLGPTAPAADAENNVKGLILYYSADVSGQRERLEVVSPVFHAHTLPTCALELSLHMFQMDLATFQVVIKAESSTWESTSFEGNSAHRWEKQKQPIGLVSQPFRVILEILNPGSAYPSHVAIDDIKAIDCYDTKNKSTDCKPRQFQCFDLICIDANQVCDATDDCIDGEDEEQECDKIPESAFCTFENGMCGWNTSVSENSKWILHKGETANSRTGPSFDHTYQNSTGTYLMTKFPSGRVFGLQTTLTSPWFVPPPYYHRNVHSQYYNTCQARFFFHKFGHNVGELRMYSLESDPTGSKPKVQELWRSYGNKGDFWWKATVYLPNISNVYQLQFTASRGVGHSEIAIDDVTLSPECFGLGVPDNETKGPDEVLKPVVPQPRKPQVKKFAFNTCGARGRMGPNDTLCAAAYRNSSTAVSVLTEPTMEGIQKWTVPESGLYTVFVKGAGGGPGVGNRGKSLGAVLRATFDWEKGEFIYLLIGQKGVDACGSLLQACEAGITKRSIGRIREMNKMRRDGGGGGGGGATYVFKIDPANHQKTPLAIAGGGGGLSAKVSKEEGFINVIPHGLMPNSSILPINGYTGTGAGGGGGWDDNTATPTSGLSLREGGRGGEVCSKSSVWETHGGFGGGGGGCASGGGGGGYRGGDASEIESSYYNGQGGTSYLMPGAIRALVEPGSNQGDGAVIIVPAQSGCGCQHLCVYLDLENKAYYCICPPDLTINIDGFSCNGHPAAGFSPKMLVVIILSVVIVISVATVCLFFANPAAKYRKARRARDASGEPLTTPEEQLNRLRNGGGMVSENNPNYEFGGNTCTEQDLRRVPRENLTLVKALGQGAFGEVYQGYLANPDGTEMQVAVKTLPELSSSQAVLDFLMEALIMSKFNHQNIVSFIGVCFEKLPRFIVLELLPGGDLKTFLRDCRPKPSKPSSLTVTDLLMLAMDVAKGCQYLEENHFIHRDIAARNCLLTTKDANRVVKIADFGMARDIYRADYYRKGGKAMLPVKWMPPEAFLDGIFTSKTDVWSFGVLLWEVISLGYMPYPGRGNQEVMQLVTSGGRLEPPTNCPGPMYHIMMQCWHPHPDERPNFSTIIERLGYCLQDPDVINAPLPVFIRAPSMERDATVMRPIEDESAGCLQVQRPDPGLLLSPGSEDYLIPMQQSSYSLNTDLQSSPSQGSADQLLELEERGQTPSSRPAVLETNFMTPATNADSQLTSEGGQTNRKQTHTPMKRQDGYTEVPAEDTDNHSATEEVHKVQQNGILASSGPHKAANRMSSIKSLDDLPVAPNVSENENAFKSPANASKHRSNLSLDPSALVRQISGTGGEPNNLPPNRYVNVDVNCNTGDSNSSISRSSLTNQNTVAGPFDGYSGVNPVA